MEFNRRQGLAIGGVVGALIVVAVVAVIVHHNSQPKLLPLVNRVYRDYDCGTARPNGMPMPKDQLVECVEARHAQDFNAVKSGGQPTYSFYDVFVGNAPDYVFKCDTQVYTTPDSFRDTDHPTNAATNRFAKCLAAHGAA